MKPDELAEIAAPHDRPIGHVQPRCERAVRALKALRAGRNADACTHIDAIGSESDEEEVWKHYLSGLLALANLDLGRAFDSLLSGLELLDREAMPEIGAHPGVSPAAPGAEGSARLRLRAAILENVGWIQRRQDQPGAAMQTHLEAYHLREKTGSYEELWETAVSLGHNAQLAGHTEVAQRWFEAAVEQGAAAHHEPHRLEALAWSNLANLWAREGKHEAAATAAQTALARWQQHDPGAKETATARLRLGHALLQLSETALQDDPGRAKEILEDALKHLETAREELLAFGAPCSAEAQTCLELEDFARRIAASLPNGEP